jgi:polyferredoxin
LKIEYFYPAQLSQFGEVIAIYSLIGSAIIFPLLAYFLGKRFYCSFICGCGGLANTAGDVFRHLSNKRLKAWKIERYSIHITLIIAVLITLFVFIETFLNTQAGFLQTLVIALVKWYAFIISFGLAGMIGVGLYPLLGTRVWCRFFCPMAAMLGLFQKMGKFRITVQKDLCISCGNCSKYCEMGIDVRSYAQRNLPVKRAACVGCGMCAHVCPRGVLKLECKD